MRYRAASPSSRTPRRAGRALGRTGDAPNLSPGRHRAKALGLLVLQRRPGTAPHHARRRGEDSWRCRAEQRGGFRRREKGENILFRVYVASGDVSQATQRVKLLRDELAAAFPDWLASRQLGIAVLAEAPDKMFSIRESVGRLKLEERILVSLGPSPDTIAECLRAQRK